MSFQGSFQGKNSLHKNLSLWILRIHTFKKGLDLTSCEEIKDDVMFYLLSGKEYEIDASYIYSVKHCPAKDTICTSVFVLHRGQEEDPGSRQSVAI